MSNYDEWKTGGANPGREWEIGPRMALPRHCGCGGWADYDEELDRFICMECGKRYDWAGFEVTR